MDNKTWHDLPAGFDLDRVIAEQLGYFDIVESSLWDDTYDDTGLIYVLIGQHKSLRGDMPLPAWSTDINAALCLDFGLPDEQFVSIKKDNEGYEMTVHWYGNNPKASGVDFALVYSQLWLQRKDR